MSNVRRSKELINCAYKCSFADGFEMAHPGLIPTKTLEKIGALIDLYMGDDIWSTNRYRKPHETRNYSYANCDQRIVPIKQHSIGDVVYILESMPKSGRVCAADVRVLLRDRASLNRYYDCRASDEFGPYAHRDNLGADGMCKFFDSIKFKQDMDRPWLDSCWMVPRTMLYKKLSKLNSGLYNQLLHRITYQLCVADLDDGYDACHLCCNGVSKQRDYVCIHPFHVVPGTTRINIKHKSVHQALSDDRPLTVHALTLLIGSKDIKITPRHFAILTEIHRRAMLRIGLTQMPTASYNISWSDMLSNKPVVKQTRLSQYVPPKTKEERFAERKAALEAWIIKQNKKGHSYRLVIRPD